MNHPDYPHRSVFFYSILGGLAASLLLMEINWQIVQWADARTGYPVAPPGSAFGHLLEILGYTAITGLPLTIVTAAVFCIGHVFRDRRGWRLVCIGGTALFVFLVILSWIGNSFNYYRQTGMMWTPPSDFAAALAYGWIWLCILVIMISSWLAGTPEHPEAQTARQKTAGLPDEAPAPLQPRQPAAARRAVPPQSSDGNAQPAAKAQHNTAATASDATSPARPKLPPDSLIAERLVKPSSSDSTAKPPSPPPVKPLLQDFPRPSAPAKKRERPQVSPESPIAARLTQSSSDGKTARPARTAAATPQDAPPAAVPKRQAAPQNRMPSENAKPARQIAFEYRSGRNGNFRFVVSPPQNGSLPAAQQSAANLSRKPHDYPPTGHRTPD